MRKNDSRVGKAVINSGTAIAAQIVTLICGFILPRLILTYFGSTYNGIISSITQFTDCIILLRAGIGGVTRAALYKPLAEHDTQKISGIMNATQRFMQKVALIFAGCLFVFACIYPFAVRSEFDWMFSFTLVLILGISTFMQSYFGIAYQMLVNADQRSCIYSAITMCTIILNTLIASILIVNGAEIRVVKLASALVFSINPIVLNVYVSKRYHLNKKAPADNLALKQRWDAFAQQVALFITNNTDIIILTIFTNLKEVSVYTVYYMIAGNLKVLVQTLMTGVDAAFGNMLAKSEHDNLTKSFSRFEFLILSVSTFVFAVALLLIEPFVMVYTRNITDVNYSRIGFGVLLCLSQFLYCIRIPYQMLAEAAGHFRQTRNGAIIEAIINVTLSVILVIRYGLIGVTIGTFCAMLFRTGQYSVYSSRVILKRKLWFAIKRLLLSVCEGLIISAVFLAAKHTFFMHLQPTYFGWMIQAAFAAVTAVLVILAGAVLCCKDDFKYYLHFIKRHV